MICTNCNIGLIPRRYVVVAKDGAYIMEALMLFVRTHQMLLHAPRT